MQGALSPQEFLTAYAQKNGIDRFKKEVNLLNGIRYETAKVFYNEGIFDKTLEQIEKILNADDSFIPAYILKGNVLYKKGNVSSAVKVWERAYRRYRNIALFLQIEGLYIKESLPYRIIRLYKRTINFHPDDRNLMTFLARLYLKLEMIDEAIKELEMLLKEDEGTKYQYLLLAESYARRGRFEESAKSYKNALDASHFTPVFTCRICKFATGEWLDRCPNCRLWNTMDAEGL
ncbi:MAG: tetratricopeptide repeat protein [Deltaproteobacteria bacterium]|nr:tetratricopeptide repeat protein [Deltaproteobacteria bacterium]